MDFLYYYYYVFYKTHTKIFFDDDPHLTTYLSLSACEYFPLILLSNIISIRFFENDSNPYLLLCILILICIINYFHFYRSGRGRRIVKEKAALYNRHKIFKIITIFFLSLLYQLCFGDLSLLNIYMKFIVSRANVSELAVVL
jgi:hypothetical protein